MIAPTERLLFLAGAVFTPMAMVAGAAGGIAAAAAGWACAVLVVAACVDAFLAAGALKGLWVVFPETVSLSRGREEHLPFQITNQGARARTLLLGLSLPSALYSPCLDMRAPVPPRGEAFAFKWPVVAGRQGDWRVEKMALWGRSPLGLWSVRGLVNPGLEVRVYPGLHQERRHLAALFSRGALGSSSVRRLGQGRDFEQLRDYIPGDSLGDIHWKVMAKRGRPVTKVYQLERTQRLMVVVDASRLTSREVEQLAAPGPDSAPGAVFPTTMLDRYATAALVLGLAARRQADLFGVLAYSDRVQGFVPAKGGLAQYNACREALHHLKPETVSPDFAEVFSFIGNRVRRRTLLVFLTNLAEGTMAESFLRHVQIAARRHLVLVAMLRPENARPLFHAPDARRLEDLHDRLAGHFFWAGLRETRKRFERMGVGFALLDNEKMAAQLVTRYLTIKQRQTL
jgi:uncharacterized protein (DUF58 family)